MSITKTVCAIFVYMYSFQNLEVLITLLGSKDSILQLFLITAVKFSIMFFFHCFIKCWEYFLLKITIITRDLWQRFNVAKLNNMCFTTNLESVVSNE